MTDGVDPLGVYRRFLKRRPGHPEWKEALRDVLGIADQRLEEAGKLKNLLTEVKATLSEGKRLADLQEGVDAAKLAAFYELYPRVRDLLPKLEEALK